MRLKLARFITVFFSGFLLMLTISIFNDWSYEKEMLANLRDHVYSKCETKDFTTFVDSALYYSHKLQQPATDIYFGKPFHSLKQYLAPSSFQNYYFGRDACGAYASFFVRLMTSAGYRAQITQVNIKHRKNAHMTVSIFANGKMYVVDPLFDHSFKGPDGKLSDIRQVSKNWYSYYSQHLPANYEPAYDYQYGWSFTNWDKFGSFSHGIYKILCFVFPKARVDTFSFRYYTQGYNKFFIVFAFIGFIFTFIHALRLSFSHSLSEYIRFRWSNSWLADLLDKRNTDTEQDTKTEP
jgi:hypothetical protein